MIQYLTEFDDLQAPPKNAPADDVTRSLPCAVGPEKSVLSALLKDPQEFMPRIIEAGFTEEHFYLPSHASLFRVLSEKFNRNEEIELVSLVQNLLDRGLLDRIGGPATLTDLYTYSPSDGHFNAHLALVRGKYILRSLIQVSNETIASAYDSPDEAVELLDQTEARIMAIREAERTTGEETMGRAVDRVIDRIKALIEGDKGAAGLGTGFGGIDAMGATLKPGEMFVIAARPSMGKTALMMNMVETLAIDQQRNTLVFSTEMTKDALIQRMICTRAKFSLSDLNRGMRPDKGDLQRIQRASLEIASAPLHLIDKAPISIGEIRAIARRKHRERKLELIAIDYLQYVRSNTRQAANSREREVAEISAGAKALAKELGIPVLLLAQLNRGPEGRSGKSLGVPRMSDLRESGAIEQDADLIGLLYREAYYAQDEEEKAALAGRAKLILAKNRNGETGDIPLTFIAELARFEDGAPYKEPDMFHESKPRSRYDD